MCRCWRVEKVDPYCIFSRYCTESYWLKPPLKLYSTSWNCFGSIHGHTSNWPVGVARFGAPLTETFRSDSEGGMKFTIKNILSVLNFSHLHRVLSQVIQLSGCSDASTLTLISSFHHPQFSERRTVGSSLLYHCRKSASHEPLVLGDGKGAATHYWYSSVSHTSDTPDMTFVLVCFPLLYFFFVLFVFSNEWWCFFRNGRCFLCALSELLSLFYRSK